MERRLQENEPEESYNSTTFPMATETDVSCGACTKPRPFDAKRHKQVYTVGVLEFRGPGTAFAQHGVTFTEYLTEAAGKKFDPPIRFEMKPIDFQTMFDETEAKTIDFIYTSPSPFSCIESEYGAESLVSHISKRVVGNQVYNLPKFAGVITARANNTEITSLKDLEGKIVAAAAISSFGGGQVQFREVQNAGLSFINDFKQLVFTGNQGRIVRGVLSGEFDAGFVRTDQIERTKDNDGLAIDPSLFKVLEPKTNVLFNEPFPFEASTQLYPEWNLAALTHISEEVSLEVQTAMLSLSAHGRLGFALEECIEQLGQSVCETFSFPKEFDVDARCDTTKEIAKYARVALINGKYADFRTTLSYIEIRSMLQDNDFIHKDPITNTWRCNRPAELYNAITCPNGYFKKSKKEIDEGCEQVGLFCEEGFQCLCSPCRKGFDVDVFPEEDVMETGCSKMSLCGGFQQTKALTFYAKDNKERASEGVLITAVVHEGEISRTIPVVRSSESQNIYQFSVSATKVGTVILEVFVNGEQISESPLRVEVQARDCSSDYGSDPREPDVDGNCQCAGDTVSIGSSCIQIWILVLIIALPVCLLTVVAIYVYVQRKRKQADALWIVNREELHFGTPVQKIGEGAFGSILLAEYRGTKVAVKCAYKRNEQGVKSHVTSDGCSKSAFASVDLEAAEEGKKTRGSSLFSLRSRNSNAQLKQSFLQEIRFLTKLRHPCISTIMGAVLASRWDEDTLIIMEYADHGSLYDVIHNDTFQIEGDFCLNVLRDICQGILFLHSATPQIIHGDLKSQNVLIDSRFRAKVADFGLARKGDRKERKGQGTPFWMAPELLRRESGSTAESDLYSFGMILYELYSRKDPFQGESYDDVIRQICDPRINKRPKIPPGCPPTIATLMKDCLEGDPQLRPTAKELDRRLKLLDCKTVEPGVDRRSRFAKQKSGRSAEVLYDVFPRHIANSLLAGRKVEPESHDCVTIFFSDIVGFTAIASESEPLKVSNMLDRLYLAFDNLARKHEVFKVETIGDAFMGVCNLVQDQSDDHVQRIAHFALDAVKAAGDTLIDEEDPEKGFVQIRVGFHSGPVVSNVVGSLNPRYGLFGDCVNVSSRMESTSVAGRIQASERSALLLRDQDPSVPLTKRGKVPVKGKGDMVTFWVGEGVTEGEGTVSEQAFRPEMPKVKSAKASKRKMEFFASKAA